MNHIECPLTFDLFEGIIPEKQTDTFLQSAVLERRTIACKAA